MKQLNEEILIMFFSYDMIIHILFYKTFKFFLILKKHRIHYIMSLSIMKF